MCSAFYISIFIFIYVIQCNCALRPKLMQRIEDVCQTATNADLNQLENIRNGKWPEKPHPALQSWALCVLYNNELMTEYGVLRVDKAFEDIYSQQERDDMEKRINKCLLTNGAYAAAKAWHYLKCVNSADPSYLEVLP